MCMGSVVLSKSLRSISRVGNVSWIIFYLFIYLFIYVFIYIFIYLFVYLFIYLFNYVFTFLSWVYSVELKLKYFKRQKAELTDFYFGSDTIKQAISGF